MINYISDHDQLSY